MMRQKADGKAAVKHQLPPLRFFVPSSDRYICPGDAKAPNHGPNYAVTVADRQAADPFLKESTRFRSRVIQV
jgi:hypothetical protein